LASVEIRAAPIWCRTQFLIGTTEHTEHTERHGSVYVCLVCSVVKQSIPIAIPIPIWMKPWNQKPWNQRELKIQLLDMRVERVLCAYATFTFPCEARAAG